MGCGTSAEVKKPRNPGENEQPTGVIRKPPQFLFFNWTLYRLPEGGDVVRNTYGVRTIKEFGKYPETPLAFARGNPG